LWHTVKKHARFAKIEQIDNRDHRLRDHDDLPRLGGARTLPIDVRLVAATNRNLTQMMDG
jgi:transcriptional regulator of acetoin/glycerol metabolism